MSQLQLSLFGVPIVKHGETTLTFSTRKALALLVYLAVEGGWHPRKTLSEAFWPELDAEHGRAALRATLYELRRLFERTHGPGERAHLRIERDLLSIEQDSSLVLDLRLVEAASKLTRRGLASTDGQAREELLARLEQASRLVRGPFLADFTLRDSQFFDDWSSQHREYWHLQVHQVFDALSMLYEQGGEVERAIESVNRWLRFDPLNEEGYRRLMRLRFSQGDRVGALRAYARCRAVLAEELQVEPEPETVALAKHIRHTAPLRLPQVHRLPPSHTSAGQPPANLLDGPFLGRSAEFGILIENYQRAHAGQPQLVVLQGEAGIGKTRLATEFVRWTQAQGAEVLVGRSLQTGQQRPYQPLIDVLRRGLERERAPADLGSPVWLAELSRLLPELRECSPDLPVPSTDEALGHNRLCEATARLVRRWAVRRPMVFWLDDMHWADTATLDLVLSLAQSLADQHTPVLLLFNLRTDTFPEGQSTWLMALKRTGISLTTLELAAFTQEETQRFIQALAWAEQPVEVGDNGSLEGRPDRRENYASREMLLPFANWLYFQTRGQPLYLVETLKGLLSRRIMLPTLQENGAFGLVLLAELLAQTPVGELIPSTVRELIRSQLSRLSPSAWTLLVAGAVLGQGLTFERLIGVAQLDEQEGLRALEELLRSGLLCEGTLVEEAQALNGYAFPGEMVREVVYQETGVTRKRLVRQRVSAILQAEAEDDSDEEIGLPHPTAFERYVHAETSKRQERRVTAGAVSREMRGMRLGVATATSGANTRHADADLCKKTPLAAREGVAVVPAAFAFPRPPPGSPVRALFTTG